MGTGFRKRSCSNNKRERDDDSKKVILLSAEATPDDPELHDERKIRLAALHNEGERAFEYVYDYGDEWHCALVLEALAAARTGVAYPRLVEGARGGPPGDVGGPHAYLDLLEALAGPKNERHAQLLEWMGGTFDPDAFDIAKMNGALARLAAQAAHGPQARPLRRRPLAQARYHGLTSLAPCCGVSKHEGHIQVGYSPPTHLNTAALG